MTKPLAEWTEKDVMAWVDKTGRYHSGAPESGQYSIVNPACPVRRMFASDTMELANRLRSMVGEAKET